MDKNINIENPSDCLRTVVGIFCQRAHVRMSASPDMCPYLCNAAFRPSASSEDSSSPSPHFPTPSSGLFPTEFENRDRRQIHIVCSGEYRLALAGQMFHVTKSNSSLSMTFLYLSCRSSAYTFSCLYLIWNLYIFII